jgi:hypothetical protein
MHFNHKSSCGDGVALHTSKNSNYLDEPYDPAFPGVLERHVGRLRPDQPYSEPSVRWRAVWRDDSTILAPRTIPRRPPRDFVWAWDAPWQCHERHFYETNFQLFGYYQFARKDIQNPDEVGSLMRRAAIATSAMIVSLSTQAQAAPPAVWSTLVGKTCMIRNTRGGVEAKFVQEADGPTVYLRAAATATRKVDFTTLNTIYIYTASNGVGYTFTYDDKSKTWSGTFAGQPSYLTCPP